MTDLFEMTVRGLTLDPLTNMPIVVLGEKDSDRALPIWIGVFEANAIAMEMDKVGSARPMTHDLMGNIIVALGGELQRVVISDLRENTFFATLALRKDGGEVTVDSRPSDAIAIALRAGAPIFVTREVWEKSRSLESADMTFDSDRIKAWLETLKPEDFGKYPT